MSNYMSSKEWDEIIYPYSNFIGASNFIPHFMVDVITSKPSKRQKNPTLYISLWYFMQVTLSFIFGLVKDFISACVWQYR